MSSRMLRKVAAKYAESFEIEEISEEDRSMPNFSNKFEMLQIESDNDSEESLDIQDVVLKENVLKKEKKKSKNLAKKIKSKKNNSLVKEMTEDELLDNLSYEVSSSSIQEDKVSLSDVLTIKIRNLNENVELQHMFGPSAAGTTTSNNHGRRNTHVLMKNNFGKRAPEWPQVSFAKLGLTMDRCDGHNDEYDWCMVSCTEAYLRGERALKGAMRLGDFQDLVREWPYHVNTLLEMAMLLTNQEDFTLAADVLKRIFYVYETISPMGLSLLAINSGGCLTRHNCSLDYKYRLNRGIFLALFQWIHYLCRRSCFITALEYCKVILNLNLKNDPLAVILMIDDVALRANQFDFLIKFHSQFNESKSLIYLPNFAFSLPLCHFLKSLNDKSKSSACSQADHLLQEALCRFPSFLRTFLDNCDIKVDDRVAQSSFFNNCKDSVAVTALIKLYMKRSLNLWKNQSVLRWLECNVQRLLDRIEQNVEEHTLLLKCREEVSMIFKRIIPLAVKRHIFLSGYTQLLEDTSTQAIPLIFDPYPPANSEGGFDHYVDNDVQEELDDSWFINLFRSFMPSFR